MIYTPLAVCMIGGRVLVTPPERVAYNMATGPGPKKRDHSALLGVDVGEQLVTRGWARCIGTGKPRPSGQWRDIYQLTAAGLEVAANVDFRVIFKDHFA